MWYSSRDDVDRCWRQPSSDTSVSRRGIRPAGDTSTYRHRGVGYGHSSNYDNVHRVQHHSITPGQCGHVNWTWHSLTWPLQWPGGGEPSSLWFFWVRFLCTRLVVTHSDFSCGTLLIGPETTGISWGSAGGYPYWAVPLQACSTLTYALITAAWRRLKWSTNLQK